MCVHACARARARAVGDGGDDDGSMFRGMRGNNGGQASFGSRAVCAADRAAVVIDDEMRGGEEGGS